MTCPFCGSDNASSVDFCRACGAELPRLSANGSGEFPTDALPLGALLAGTYAVERVLGQGGFGITYCCHDQMLDRRVAIKEFFPAGCRRDEVAVMPSRGLSDTSFSEARAQFLAEARLLARCHHAGIVGVHTAFEANSTAYMVMELLHGSHLGQLLDNRGGRLAEAEAIPLIQRAGEALQFVHDQGLLHRDVKPDNIIVCDDGRVMLIDFGTAREYAQGQAQGHTIVVTPGYAPLEQYAKQAKRGAFTDVYGLAATLYHLLTGQAPPAASDRAVGVRLRPVREENPQISLGVARAVEAGLEMEIAKRPQSVRDFLDQIQAPVQAVENSAVPVDLRPQTSLPTEKSMMTDALVAIIAARQQTLNDLLPDPQAVVSPIQLAPLLAPQSPLSASQSPLVSPVSPSAPPVSPYASSAYAFKSNSNVHDPSTWVFWMLGGIAVFTGLALWGGSCVQTPQSPSYSTIPFGSSFPSSSSPNYSNYQPAPPTISNAEAAKAAALQEMESTPAILPISTEILPISAQKKSNQVEKSTSTATETPTETPYILSSGLAEFSADGRFVAYLDKDAVVRVWSLSRHRVVSSLPQSKTAPPSLIRFSPDAKTVVLTYGHQQQKNAIDKVVVWNLATEKSVGTLSVDPQIESLSARAVLANGKVLITKRDLGSLQRRWLLWNPRTGKQSAGPLKTTDNVLNAVFAPNGQQLVTDDSRGTIRWWNSRVKTAVQGAKLTSEDRQNSPFYASNAPDATFSTKSLPVVGLTFSPDGSYLASRDPLHIRVFDSKAQEIGAVSTGYSPHFAVSPGGDFVVEGGNVQTPERNMLWSVRNPRKLRLKAPNGEIKAWVFSPDGQQIIGLSSSPERVSLVTWPVDGKPIAPFSNLQTTAISASNSFYQPSGFTLSRQLTTSWNGQSLELSRFNGSVFNSFNVGKGGVAETRFSLDGRFFAISKSNRETQIWRVETGQRLAQLAALKSASHAVLSKDLAVLTAENNLFKSLVFSPDNSLMARTGSARGKDLIEVWSLEKAPRRLASFPLGQPLTAFTFSLDNRTLICGDAQGRLSAYDVATQKLVAQAQNGSTPISQLVSTEQGLAVASVGSDDVSNLVVSMFDVPSKGETSGQTGRAFQKKSQILIDEIRNPSGAVAISPDGRFLATQFIDNSAPNTTPFRNGVSVWHLPSGSLLQRLPVEMSDYDSSSGTPNTLRVNALSFSEDGSRLDCVIRQVASGKQEMLSWQVPPREESSP